MCFRARIRISGSAGCLAPILALYKCHLRILQRITIRNNMKKTKPTNYLTCSFLLFLVSLNFSLATAVEQNTSTIAVNVGVILDDLDSITAKVWLSCINMALSDFHTSPDSSKSTRLVLNIRDSRADVVDAAAAGLDLIKNVQVQAIIGPKSSMQANFLIDLGDKAQVPLISFLATSPSLSSKGSPYFFRATEIDSSQVRAISNIIKNFGWREAVPIYVDNQFGEGVLPYLVDALQQVKARIPYRSVIPPMATDDQLVAELYKLMTMQTRVFIVHMSYDLGSRVFGKARELGMMNEGYVWIMTDGLTNYLSTLNDSVMNSMEGSLGVRPYVPRTKELIDFRVRWRRKFQQENPAIDTAELDFFGLWAYDATYALATAIENVGTTIFGFQNTTSNTSMINSSIDLETFRVSQSGQLLRQSLSRTRFKGLTGDFSFVNGELQSSAFEIVNVNGDGAVRTIGFWTSQGGLLKKISLNSTNANNVGLRSIIWPGDSTSIPKGWEIPTNGKKLRVGVPVDNGFPEFVKVVLDPITNTTEATGSCIDIFNAAIQKLPYAVTYDFIPFALSKPDGTPASTYNDLVQQVFLGNFDAVVAATTIRGNRSLYVDFTLPFTESGVGMLVPMKDQNKSKNAWFFLQPLAKDLWLSTVCCFIFIAFVIWFLEHRINGDFRGNPWRQISTSFWFSFSTITFSQRERVVSNSARFVVLIWVFVIMILTQSYTASLTSRLTIQQLQPTYTDINELINNKEYVGYPEGSFVYELLIQSGFDPSMIRVYKSIDECDDLLTKGSRKGGISAAIDETPLIRLFLAKFCSKYTMVGPIFKTDGFAFVFRKGSPLAPDISRAILNVTEGDEMKEIEKKWFSKQTECSTTKPMVSESKKLGLDTFWGLFSVVGAASLFALLISTLYFCTHDDDSVIVTGTPPNDASNSDFNDSLGEQGTAVDQRSLIIPMHIGTESDSLNHQILANTSPQHEGAEENNA
ncbi:glutamate receptor 2.1-like isoform X2 [Rosa rugosa]|uniref:glutamate receptor 2.1-like isoform X2 n=1 Tax=Rosa rugosa TaxID=74645 RepID=UPI002B40428F|nr:glutamate receptor 2.1-like isoform X2 [Rosa rugosa]